MHVLCVQPSSMILSKTKYCRRLNCDVKIMPKQVEAKRDGQINLES